MANLYIQYYRFTSECKAKRTGRPVSWLLSLGSGRPVFLRSSARMVRLAGREVDL
jgi:hypothetical protein